MLKHAYLLLLLFVGINSFAQNCSIKITDDLNDFTQDFEEEMKSFFSLEFIINGITFNSRDTNTISISPNTTVFDTIHYSFIDRNGKTYAETFLCQLRNDETYTISPCVCCGVFLMTPEKNAKRGFVRFNNKSSNEYITIASEIDSDTLYKTSNTDYIFSSISMNCGFRPNQILLARYSYFDEKYQYENWKTKTAKEKELLEQDRKLHLAYQFNFLFLHEEKLTLTIAQDGKTFDLKLD